MSGLDRKLREIIQHAYANAPEVRARFDAAGIGPDDVQTVADLVKVPILPKDEIIRLQQKEPPFGGMLGVPADQVTHVFFSPGPIYEPAPEPDDSAWDVAVDSLRRSGFRPGEIVLNSFSYHLVPAGFLFDGSLTRLGCTVVPGGVGNSDLQLKMVQDLGITGYVGTPSFLLRLLDKAKEMEMPMTIDHALVSAEPLLPPMKAAIEAHGVAIGNAYATADFGLIALNQGPGMAFQLLAEPIVEVVDPDTGQLVGPGETGEVAATNFSKTYPLIRIGTGDMAMNMDPKPGESTQTDRSIVLVGRSGDAAKVRGMFVHPNQLRFATGQIPGVHKVQGAVSRVEQQDHFVLRVEADAGEEETAVSEQIKQAVRNLCRVRVDEVQFVAVGSIGEGSPGMVDERDWNS